MIKKMHLGKKCTGCEACVNICPEKCIAMQQEEDGFLYPYIDFQKCIDCKACFRVCENTLLQRNISTTTSYAAYARDEIRSKCSSGGVFRLLAEEVIKKNGVVCGAAYVSGYKVEHIIIEEQFEIERLQTSKYVQSRIGDVYHKIKQKLDSKRLVLFTGTPCQVAGLKAYLGREYKNLYTVDLCCHGVPSQSLFDQYIKEEYKGQVIEQINFRDKRDGWTYLLKLSVKTSHKEYVSNIKEDPYYIAFSKRLSLRECCGECDYATNARCGDITLGDFWRIWDYDKALDDRKGTSLVMVNTIRGKTLIEDIAVNFETFKEVPFEYAVLGNVTLDKCMKLSPYRKQFIKNVQKNSIRDSIYMIENKRVER